MLPSHTQVLETFGGITWSYILTYAFPFLNEPTNQTTGPDSTHDGSNDAILLLEGSLGSHKLIYLT